MKKLISLLLLISLKVSATTYTVSPYTSDIIASIQGYFTVGINGDVIVLPAGSYPCLGVATCTKFISIKGQGKAFTILYRPESASDANCTSWKDILKYNINSTASSNIVISDIAFKSKRPSMDSNLDGNGNDVTTNDGLSLAADCGVEMIKCKDFVIYNCRFENFGNGGVTVYHDDSIVGGLILKNEFIHNIKGTAGLGLGYGIVIYGMNTKWVYNPEFGSSKFIFIEDNYFDYHKHSIAAGGCAKYVFRNNKVYNNIAANSTSAIDMHEARLTPGDNYYAARACEVYNDTIINTTFRNGSGTAGLADNTPVGSTSYTVTSVTTRISKLTEACIKFRGGSAVVYSNYVQGYRFGLALVANTVASNSTAYPIPYQTGYLSGLQLGANNTGTSGGNEKDDAWFGTNTVSLYDNGSTVNKYFYNYNDSSATYTAGSGRPFIKHGRDYHFSMLPGYTAYTYPHPLSALVGETSNGIVVNGSFSLACGHFKSRLYVTPKYDAKSIVGSYNVELPIYKSYTDKVAGYYNVYPVVAGRAITGCTITVASGDTVKSTAPCTFGDYIDFLYKKTKVQLTTNTLIPE